MIGPKTVFRHDKVASPSLQYDAVSTQGGGGGGFSKQRRNDVRPQGNRFFFMDNHYVDQRFRCFRQLLLMYTGVEIIWPRHYSGDGKKYQNFT